MAYTETIAYWRTAIFLINTWANYLKVKKLLINATHVETRHKVWHVVQEYYGGSICRAREAEEERSTLVDFAVGDFRKDCEATGVEPVDRDWLYHNLTDSRTIASYRGKAKRRLRGGKPPQSLRDL